ncbi:MAG: serine hydrolase [Sphingobium sp.]|nr:serine hydrolase [Sphingobium sp.]
MMRTSGVEARGYEATPTRAASAYAAPQIVSMPTLAPQQVQPGSPALAALIQSLGAQFAGRVGIAVQSVDQGWAVDFNGSQLFPQQSVSKLWVAMTMFDAIDRGKVTLSTPVTIRTEDLTLFHQPVAAMVKGAGYQTTLSDLFTRAMTQSDNTANDSVLRTVGGPDAVRGFLARRFVSNVRFGPGERLLQSQTAGITWSQDMALGRRFYSVRNALPLAERERALNAYAADPIDGASPLAIVGALAKLKRGQMLSPTSTALLLETMGEAHTGPNRIKGGVPAGWSYAHKTGTGQELGARQVGYNDVGIMTAPDGSSYAVAIMIGDTRLPIPKRWELMQSVARAVAALHQPQPLGGGTVATSYAR